VRGGVDHVLAIVEHQQAALAGERVFDDRERRDVALRTRMQRGGDRLRDLRAVGERGKLAEPDAVGKGVDQFGRGFQHEARLARTSGADQRDHPF
jgi:hypothetical protein